MICNVAIEYSKEMNTIDFRDEVITPVSLKAARQIVHHIMYEEEFDQNIVIPDDPYVGVKLVPRAKNLIQKALTNELKDSFSKIIFDYVYNTPVKLRATKDVELLQFVFSADLNLSDEQLPMWQNTKIEIHYVENSKKD